MMNKYLKTYKMFESLSVDGDIIVSDIKDILLPLDDIGLNTEASREFYSPTEEEEIYIRLINYNTKEILFWDDIKDEILRLIDYLKGSRFELLEVNVALNHEEGTYNARRRFNNLDYIIRNKDKAFSYFSISFNKI